MANRFRPMAIFNPLFKLQPTQTRTESSSQTLKIPKNQQTEAKKTKSDHCDRRATADGGGRPSEVTREISMEATRC
ncbi:uncharacterized protein G2W53_034326 [Senna tora]|uniref:Uncharacterized protein n=1 Tax=Senna tora TaxID=362788 RepID=A0A834W7M9_9FABA|nr:uncharacterized protein G2W53_034326 [Senna tora]